MVIALCLVQELEGKKMARRDITIQSDSNTTNGWHITGSDRDGSFDSFNPTINLNDGDTLRIYLMNSASHPLNTGNGDRYYEFSPDNPQNFVLFSYAPLDPNENSRTITYNCWNHPSSMSFNIVIHRTSSSATTTTAPTPVAATYEITIESSSNLLNGWHLTGSDRDGLLSNDGNFFSKIDSNINVNDGDVITFILENSSTHPFMGYYRGDGTPNNRISYYFSSSVTSGWNDSVGAWNINSSPASFYCTNHAEDMNFEVITHPVDATTTSTTTSTTTTTEAPDATTRCLSSDVEVSIAALGGELGNRYSFGQGVSSAAGNNGDSTFNNSAQAGSTTSIDFRILTVSTGSYVLRNVPSTHPIAFHTTSAALTYTGTSSVGTKTALDGETREYFYGDVTVTVDRDFGTISYECYYHGYMGGQNNFKFDSSCPQGSTTTSTTLPPEEEGEPTTSTTTKEPTPECYCGEIFFPAGSLEAEDANSVHIKINNVKYDLYHKYPASIDKEQELITSTKKMSNDSDLYVNKLSINFGSDYVTNPIVVRHNIKITIQTEDGHDVAFKYIGVNNTSTTIKDGIIEFDCSNLSSSLNIRNKILLVKVKSVCTYSADISCEKMPDSIALRNVINTIHIPFIGTTAPPGLTTTASPPTRTTIPVVPPAITNVVHIPNMTIATGFGTESGFGDSVIFNKVGLYFAIGQGSFHNFKVTYDRAVSPTTPQFFLDVFGFTGGARTCSSRLRNYNITLNRYWLDATTDDSKWSRAKSRRDASEVLKSPDLTDDSINFCPLPQDPRINEQVEMAYWFADQGRPVDNTSFFNGFTTAIGRYTVDSFYYGLPANYIYSSHAGMATDSLAAGVVRFRIRIEFTDTGVTPAQPYVLIPISGPSHTPIYNYYVWDTQTFGGFL
tara:strand:- start:2898 stop:5594 length:2697 start_codon:yes stop_codon:yes gene_type:complete